MYSDGLQFFSNVPLVIAGMLIFLTVFSLLLLRTFQTHSKDLETAKLPLAEEEVIHERQYRH